ncbi:hypothetical protein [Criblamydia sequanensis]|uniref:Membrane protein n=1 Tax=Candidatus Criblamydia sequanensis CRIB-18 TaxID=1437425 RepID=A0A090D102_9BACT|nr:hypothetical protein [Criblamydia sequanensis]CDR33585.1 putative membrane protein [Criblamydia sequanensis CRIB-18]
MLNNQQLFSNDKQYNINDLKVIVSEFNIKTTHIEDMNPSKKNQSSLFKKIGALIFISTVIVYFTLSGYHLWVMRDLWKEENSISALRASVSELEKNERSLKFSLDLLKREEINLSELQTLKAQIEQEKRAWDAQKREEANLASRILDLQNTHNKLATSSSNLREEVTHLQNQLNQTKIDLEIEQKRKSSLIKLESQVVETKRQLTTLQQSIKELKTQEEKFNEQLQEINDLKTKKNSLLDEVVEIERNCDSKRSDLTILKKDLELIEHNFKSLKRQEKETSKICEDLTAKLSSSKSSLSALQSEVNTKSIQKQELENVLINLRKEKNELITARSKLDEFQKKLQEVLYTFEQKSKELQEMQLQLTQATEKSTIEQERLKELQNKAKREMAEISKRSEEVYQLQLQITSLHQQKNILLNQKKAILDQLELEEKQLLARKAKIDKQLKEGESRFIEAQNQTPDSAQVINGAI